VTESIAFLSGTAASIGFLHTLMGPDHYLPFVAMSQAGGWSLRKTLLITLLCGVGHVLSSVILGLIGIALGVAVFNLEAIERFRGDVAGWLLLTFGLVYLIWGLVRAIRNKPHTHWHVHADGTAHSHEHVHTLGHRHIHPEVRASAKGSAPTASRSITPWVLFTIFMFGPCEPLIPILMYPAAKGHLGGVGLVAVIFGVTTIFTMIVAVMLAHRALGSPLFSRYERYSHALAGLLILVSAGVVRAGL